MTEWLFIGMNGRVATGHLSNNSEPISEWTFPHIMTTLFSHQQETVAQRNCRLDMLLKQVKQQNITLQKAPTRPARASCGLDCNNTFLTTFMWYCIGLRRNCRKTEQGHHIRQVSGVRDGQSEDSLALSLHMKKTFFRGLMTASEMMQNRLEQVFRQDKSQPCWWT